nr:immunoglobulin heavy chain junction region [Mus musculus]
CARNSLYYGSRYFDYW